MNRKRENKVVGDKSRNIIINIYNNETNAKESEYKTAKYEMNGKFNSNVQEKD